MSTNPEVQLSLEDGVQEVLSLLTGLTLEYDPELDRFRAVTRFINQALRRNALEKEWSYYSALLSMGIVEDGDQYFTFPDDKRPRIINDDSVRLVDVTSQIPFKWAYFLPRDALHKYSHRDGLWCSVTRNGLSFSRPLWNSEVGLEVQCPVMREPEMFRLPATPEEDVDPLELAKFIDFQYPDVITSRAAMMYAMTDPVMQPRVQTLELMYKDLMYQVIERDDRATDAPYYNDFLIPVQNDIMGETSYRPQPLADERMRR